MTYDPFLDPPRPLPRPGCSTSLVRPVMGASAASAVVIAFARWGLGDALAVAGWLSIVALFARAALGDRRGRVRRRRSVLAHPTSRLCELPSPRSNVRILTSPKAR